MNSRHDATNRLRWKPTLGSAMIGLIGLGALGCQVPPQSAMAFENGLWFDGQSFVAGARFAVDGLLTETRPASVGTTIDLQGRHVVPAYGEAHTHLLEPTQIDAYVQHYLQKGIFYARVQSGIPSVRREIEAALNLPTSFDFLSANQGFTGPGGHPLQIFEQVQALGMIPPIGEADGNAIFILESEEDLAEKWPRFLEGNPDFVKIFLHYSEVHETRTGDPRYQYRRGLDPRLAKPIVDRAHAAGLEVSAHGFTAADFRTALAADVDHFAHFPGTGYDRELSEESFTLTEDDARLAADRGMTVTTTISDMVGDDPEGIPDEQREYIERVIRPNMDKLRRAGVPILIGSDRVRITTDSEAAVLSALDLFDNIELLHAWAVETPRRIFPARRIGGLGEGYEASFLVLDGDPLLDFTNAQNIVLRVKQGHLLFPREPEFDPLGG